MKLRVIQVLSESNRVSSVDVFRGFAIVLVVLYHYGSFLPYGYIGVDLFFVISGLLVGGVLTREFQGRGQINYPRFILQRGLKIWPSYYAFLFIGNGVAMLLYSSDRPDQIIHLWDLKRYLLFFQNYTGKPFHFSFDHVWSLCVEEHFYILLPLLFLFLRFFVPPNQSFRYMFILVGLSILFGILLKVFSLYFTNSQDTYSGTHNRIDALSWGVLLNLILITCGNQLSRDKRVPIFFVIGVALCASMLLLKNFGGSIFFNKVVFHSVVPFSFFLMILGLYYLDFSKLKVIRVIAYFSFNWYLWHPLFSYYIFDRLGDTFGGLILYLTSTFLVGAIATVLVEETFLAKREKLIAQILRSE